MRVTKFGHACVRIEHDGATVVLDPGVFAEPEAVDGADAVLITHEHQDHYSADHLRRTDAPVWTIEAVAAKIREEAPDLAERVTVVSPEEDFDIGVPVRAVGELHAVIHPEYPRFHNSGYVLTLGGTKVYHPGDALTLPGEQVDLLCLPVSGPWLKISESIDFGRDVGAARNLAIHDRVYSDAGLGLADAHITTFLEARGLQYVRLADGKDL
jgi:L-ascorbate metabolism protein UlaG (beta-lactamase superfamily)